MKVNLKNRQKIHYILIVCIICIQLIILLFFYNEYFNEKKLSAIEQQLNETKVLKNITANARDDLSTAQYDLQKYVTSNNKEHLEEFFQSLRSLSQNIDSIETYTHSNQMNESSFHTKEGISQLNKLERLIDSTYKVAQQKIDIKKPPKIKEIELKNQPVRPDVEIHHISDSVEKKSFFPRLKDAITGNVEVKRDTTIIIAKFKNSIDTAQVKTEIDSTINAINQHYKKELERFKSQIELVDSRNKNLNQVYVKLIDLSNHLMGIYNQKVEEFDSDLEQQYNYQNSLNHKIRRYTVFGLLALTLIVLGILIYYTQLNFQFEKELRNANQIIAQNLNFKNRILGMFSHEVRGPLKIMNLFLQRIQKRTEDKKIQEYLKSIEFTNNSLLLQANQILDYAKNQEKPLSLQLSEFRLKEEVQSLLTTFRPYIESRNNQFQTDVAIPEDLIVYADSIKIHQLFINILGNSNKFTENGEISVICKTKEVGNKVQFSVKISDTGIGISKEDIKRIFEPYYQGIISQEIENLGAGLGLNLCREIVQLFNGTIYAESEMNKGTTVSFELYLENATRENGAI